MGQGLLIDYQDGHSPIEIQANIRAPSFCRSIPFSTGGDTVTIDEYIPGSEFLIIPRNCIQEAQVANQGKVWRVCNHIFAHDGNQITYRTWASNLGGNQSFKAIWDSTVWQILPVSNRGMGLLVANSTDMTSITDASRVGSCVFAGTVHVNDQWRVQDIPGTNRSTLAVFARWNDPDTTLEFDGEIVYARSSQGTPRECDVNFAVFGVAPIEAPPGHGGLAIWNGSNALTFSTYRRPFLWDGFKVGLSRDWQDIGNRMVSLGRYGVDAVSGGHHTIGFQMQGNQVRLNTGINIDHDSKDFNEWMSGEVPCITNIL
ncbi:DUF6453 family protein [Klebsiella pneumoniae]|nr:DUF6453 family protein [Klebsiella pneumoniae]